MKTNLILFTVIALAGGITACSSSSDSEDTTKDQNEEVIEATSTTDSAANARKEDADFVMEAAGGGMMEVEIGKMALTKASSSEVKKFAQMMVDDHTKANNELKALAEQKSITLPAALTDKHQKMVDDLMKKSGKNFDKDYMDMMVSDHKKDIDAFKEASEDANDADIKAFASKTLPTLTHHLDEAQRIEKKTDRM